MTAGRRDLHIVIVGAGIGGLTAALGLHAAGVTVTVIEAVRRPRPLGVGINLQPHAVRELDELGLGSALAARAIETATVRHTDPFGNDIWSEPRGRALGYRWPQYSVHRGDLQMLLLDAVRARLGDDAVRTGVRFTGLTERADGVTLDVHDRTVDRPDTIDADGVVGADGLHSAVRSHQHRGPDPLRPTGLVMWRGLCETGGFLDGRTMVVVGDTGRMVVAYPVSRPAHDRGRALVNWMAQIPDPDGAGTDEIPDWNRAGDAADVLAHFDGWGPAWLDVACLVRGSPEVLYYPMVDRDPLPGWGGPRVTLLGDAAHPMLPVGSNGGSQAVVDARVLAHAVATGGDVVAGFDAYEQQRREATGALVMATRANPVYHQMGLVGQRAPEGFDHVGDVLTDAELDVFAAAYDRISHQDVEHLNTRRSLTPSAPRDEYSLGVNDAEQARLLAQCALHRDEAVALLSRTGLCPGGHALDMGCGPLGVLDLLAERVGATGRVVGVDRDPRYLAMAAGSVRERDLGGVELVEADATATGLPDASFDLVHERLVLVNVPRPDEVVAEMTRLTRPDGWVVVQDVDWISWTCLPAHPAWARLSTAVAAACSGDVHIGRRLPTLLRAAGLVEVGLDAHARVFRHGEPYHRLLLRFVEIHRDRILAAGTLTADELDDCTHRLGRHLDDPDTDVLYATMVQAWGRKVAS